LLPSNHFRPITPILFRFSSDSLHSDSLHSDSLHSDSLHSDSFPLPHSDCSLRFSLQSYCLFLPPIICLSRKSLCLSITSR
jgi:hypothetical protein